MPLSSTSTAPSFVVVAVLTTASRSAVRRRGRGRADGCAPGDTVAFDDDPHAASAITAVAPTTSGAILRFFNAFIVFIVLVPIAREARPGFVSN